MAAMIFKLPPQFGQSSMSMSKTRLSSLAQLRRAGAPRARVIACGAPLRALVCRQIGPKPLTGGAIGFCSRSAAIRPTAPEFGLNGKFEKSFDADAHHPDGKFVIEVEAGRGVLNNQFLKDFFQACMMDDIEYLALAVRNTYLRNHDCDRLCVFFETLYASRRLEPPLKGILVIGY
jgi:hypothetical protein